MNAAMEDPVESDRFDELLLLWHEQRIANEELAELNELLREPGNRARMYSFFHLTSAIVDTLKESSSAATLPMPGDESPSASAPPTAKPESLQHASSKRLKLIKSKKRRGNVWIWWALAATVAIVASAHFYNTRQVQEPAARVIARIEAATPGAMVRRDGKSLAAIAGMNLHSRDVLVNGGTGALKVKYEEEETRIELASQTDVELADANGQKKLDVLRGRLHSSVARQPAGKPLSARAVPQDAIAVVVGTEFTLDVSDMSAVLAVSEGAVSFVRGGRSLRVDAGRSATVATDGALAYNDILLLPRDGRLVGGAWRVVEDPRAVEGKAWEALKDDKPNSLKSYVEFQFDALAGVDYHLWVRGYSLIAASEPQRTRITSDEIFISLLNGKFVNPPPNPMPEPLNEDCWLVDYFSRHQSYFWCGGSTPHGKGDSDTDYVNCVIRFSTSGTQTIRLHIIEAPMRVNAVWLSTSQRSRPEAANAGPPPNPGK